MFSARITSKVYNGWPENMASDSQPKKNFVLSFQGVPWTLRNQAIWGRHFY